MLSLKYLQDAVSKETGKPIKDFENPYEDENKMSSKASFEREMYEREFAKPLMNAVGELTKTGYSYNDVKTYAMSKHGIERNMYFAWKRALAFASTEYGSEYASQLANEYNSWVSHARLCKIRGISQEEYYSMIDAKAKQLIPEYSDYRKTDYSGLTELTGETEKFESKAKELITNFESEN